MDPIDSMHAEETIDALLDVCCEKKKRGNRDREGHRRGVSKYNHSPKQVAVLRIYGRLRNGVCISKKNSKQMTLKMRPNMTDRGINIFLHVKKGMDFQNNNSIFRNNH